MANIRMKRGTTKRWTGRVTAANAYRNITNDTIYMTVKSRPSLPDASALFQLTNNDGITLSDPVNGEYTIQVDPSRTSGCPPRRTAYYYDISIIYSTGEKFSLEDGYFIVESNVTNATS